MEGIYLETRTLATWNWTRRRFNWTISQDPQLEPWKFAQKVGSILPSPGRVYVDLGERNIHGWGFHFVGKMLTHCNLEELKNIYRFIQHTWPTKTRKTLSIYLYLYLYLCLLLYIYIIIYTHTTHDMIHPQNPTWNPSVSHFMAISRFAQNNVSDLIDSSGSKP